METKPLIAILSVLVIILIVLFGFIVYDNIKSKTEIPKSEPKKETHIIEEIVEPEDIKEPAEIPLTDETGKEVKVLNEVTILIKDFKFYPKEITISPGTKVIWFNNDTVPHKVVAYDRVFYGSRILPGEKYEFTFTKEGTHPYFDGVFPKSGKGKIIVKEEPLPITGGVIGIDLNKKESNAKFALLVVLFVVMAFALSHAVYHYPKY